MSHVTIELTVSEFAVAVQSAMTRMLVSAGQGINHASTYRRTLVERLQEETVGCCAELAMGKFINQYFIPEVGTFHHKPDCLRDIEMRATARQDGRLIVRNNDDAARRYVFATVTGQTVTFVGWMYGYEAKQSKYLSNPNGYREAWFVPQTDLRPIDTLDFSEATVVAPPEQVA